jgi:hypothetical protein
MSKTGFSGPLEIGEGGTIGRPSEVIAVPLSVLAQANTDFTVALPRCRVLRITQRTNTAYTGTTVTLQLGTTAGGQEVVAAGDIKAQAAARALTLVAAAAPGLSDFGGTLFGRLAQTGPTAVGAGEMYVEFVRLGDA